MFARSQTIAQYDAELAKAIADERQRQEDHVELIASENYASPLVMAIQDSVFTNKYAEGYPDKRYYSGCENVDVAERLAIERAKQAGELSRDVDAAEAAVFLVCTTQGLNVLAKTRPSRRTLEAITRHAFTALGFEA